jgi:hypothetical protein
VSFAAITLCVASQRVFIVAVYFVMDSVRNHVRWVPCHHGMARPQVADGRNGLQIWRVAANILNKQSLTANKGWSSSFGGWAWS